MIGSRWLVSVVVATTLRGLAAEEPSAPQSPRIEALRAAAPDARTAAEDALWAELQRKGTPLVEPIDGDPHHSRVTFLWRGDADLKNVAVITAMSLKDFPGSALERVPGTRTWARTYVLPNDARLGYRFAPDDSGVPFEQERNLMKRMQSWRTDLFNPLRAEVAPGVEVSVLQLPDAPDARWSKASPDTPKGTVREVQVPLGKGAGTRQGWVYVPAKGARPSGLVVFLDGQSYTTLIPGPTILDNLIAARAIRPVAALFLAAADDREAEYARAAAVADQLATSVLAFAREQTGTRPGPRETVIVGDSLAGLQAACTALAHPSSFGAVLTQSGSFFRAPAGEEPESVARRLSSGGAVPRAWYLEVGLLENERGPPSVPGVLRRSRASRLARVAQHWTALSVATGSIGLAPSPTSRPSTRPTLPASCGAP